MTTTSQPDPGDGWELLAEGTPLKEGDETWIIATQSWYKPSHILPIDSANEYPWRRRIAQAQDEWKPLGDNMLVLDVGPPHSNIKLELLNGLWHPLVLADDSPHRVIGYENLDVAKRAALERYGNVERALRREPVAQPAQGHTPTIFLVLNSEGEPQICDGGRISQSNKEFLKTTAANIPGWSVHEIPVADVLSHASLIRERDELRAALEEISAHLYDKQDMARCRDMAKTALANTQKGGQA